MLRRSHRSRHGHGPLRWWCLDGHGMGGSHHRRRLRRDWHQAPGRVCMCMLLCVRMLCWLGNVHVWDHHCWRGTTYTHRVWGCRHHGKYRHAHVLDGVGRSGSNGSGRRQLLMGQLQKVGRHCRAAHLHGRRAGHGRYSWLFLLLQGRWGRHPVQNGLYGRRVGILPSNASQIRPKGLVPPVKVVVFDRQCHDGSLEFLDH